jgi:hypothetical protein
LIDFEKLERPQRYFAPFDDDVRRAVAAARDSTWEVLRLAETAAVFRNERHPLLDLSRIEWRVQRVVVAAVSFTWSMIPAPGRFCANSQSQTAGSS